MFSQISPNMLKTYEQCPKKFYFKYVKNINMPVNDDIFEFGKNIHALASYYLRGENIDNMEKALSPKESEVWSYLKSSEYFKYEVIKTEYNLAVKIAGTYFGGRLDALVKSGDTYFILDYKTGSAPKNAQYDYQTMIYLLCVAEFFKTNRICFVYLDLKNRTEVKVNYSDELRIEYDEKLKKICSKIINPDNFTKKSDCSCEYSKICY